MPVNFHYEQMSHAIAASYSLDPEFVKDNRSQYDYYEMLLQQIQKLLAQEYTSEQKRKKNNSK